MLELPNKFRVPPPDVEDELPNKLVLAAFEELFVELPKSVPEEFAALFDEFPNNPEPAAVVVVLVFRLPNNPPPLPPPPVVFPKVFVDVDVDVVVAVGPETEARRPKPEDDPQLFPLVLPVLIDPDPKLKDIIQNLGIELLLLSLFVFASI